MAIAEPRIDRAARVIAAAPRDIYRALTDPAALARWRPPDGMSGRIDHFDLRVGGAFRMTLIYDDPHGVAGKSSEREDVVDGVFAALDADRRVVERVTFQTDDPAFAGEMTITTRLTPTAGGTEVSIVCEDVPSGVSPTDHAAGLKSTLANLAAFVERRG